MRKAGRCFVCLKRHHLSRDCRSKFNSKNCRGRHHISICTQAAYQDKTKKPSDSLPDPERNSEGANVPRTSSVLYVGAQTPILLQTARLQLVGMMTETQICEQRLKSIPPIVSSEAQIEIERAKLLWIIDIQNQLAEKKQFPVWKEQFGLFLDQRVYGGVEVEWQNLPFPSLQKTLFFWTKNIT